MSTKIKQINFKGEETYIGFVTSDQPRDCNVVINDKDLKRSDLPRHADFVRAMDRLKPHLLIACGFQEPQDCNGNFLTSTHFNDFFSDSDEEKDRFGGLTITGILIQGKHAVDGVQLFGTKESPFGIPVPIKTPPIPLTRQPEGYNYPLTEIFSVQVEKVLFEAEQYQLRKKHGAGVQLTANLPTPPKEATITNMKAREAQANIEKIRAAAEQGDLVGSV